MLCKINGKYYKLSRWLPLYLIFQPWLKNRKGNQAKEEPQKGVSKEFVTAILTIIGLFAWFLVACSVSQWSLLLGILAFLCFAVACIISLSKGIIFLIRTGNNFVSRMVRGAIKVAKKVWKFKITLYRINGRWL